MSFQLASVVLPVYNQAEHIETVLREYLSAVERLDFPVEILPVINGPRRDNSLEICRQLEHEYKDHRNSIRTLCIDQGGWGRAVRHGLAQVAGDLVCYTNSARTTAKDLVLMLLYASVHNDCVVKANRKIRENWKRRLGSLLYNLECRYLFDLAYWDINGTPKLFPRSFTPLMNLQENGDLIDLEFNALCRRLDYQVLEVPVFSKTRHSGRSTTNWRSAFRMYAGGFELKRKMTAALKSE
jgi:glycosyltransferase involved in cell wall biosynthesis